MAELRFEDLVCVGAPRVAYDFKGRVSNANGTYPATVVGTQPEPVGTPVSVRGWGNVVGSCLFPGRNAIRVPVDGALRGLNSFAIEMAIKIPSPARAPTEVVRMNLMEATATCFAFSLRISPARKLSLHGSILIGHAGSSRFEGGAVEGGTVEGGTVESSPVPEWEGTGASTLVPFDQWVHVGMTFTGDDLVLLQGGVVVARRVFRNARLGLMTPNAERDAYYFVGTAPDGANYQFAGQLGGIRIWDGVPAVYHDALARAAQTGLGAITSRYDDIPDARRVLGKPTPGPAEVEGGTVEGSAGEEEVFVLGKTTGRIRTHEKGCIVWSPNTGARLITYQRDAQTPWKPAFEKSVQSERLGFPLSEVCNTRVHNISGPSKVVRFENGAAFWNPNLVEGDVPVYGDIFGHYLKLRAERGLLGMPLRQQTATQGCDWQEFQNGRIYRTSCGTFDFWGEILDCYLRNGEAAGPLGAPTSGSSRVRDEGGKHIGFLATFEQGAIYAGKSGGAYALTDAWLEAYKVAGGPQGELGFPCSDEGRVNGTEIRYVDFENGIIVRKPDGTFRTMTALQLILGRVDQPGNIDDGLGNSDAELLIDAWIWVNGVGVEGKCGYRFWTKEQPRIDSYDFKGWGHTIKGLRHDTTLRFKVTLHDVDSESDDDIINKVKGPDYLGSTEWQADITNLWGMLEGASYGDGEGSFSGYPLTAIGEGHQETHIEGRSRKAKLNAFNFSWSMGAPAKPIDWSVDFRKQGWWHFENFKTIELTPQLCEATYTDINHIDPESWLEIALNPFDTLFKYTIYAGLADKGNCFGMAVAALWSYHGKSMLREHIYDNYRLVSSDRTIDPDGLVPTRGVREEINIRHGYQLGVPYVKWLLSRLLDLELLDPRRAFDSAKKRLDRREPVVVSMYELFGRGHAVLAYDHEPGNDSLHGRLVVADPNIPYHKVSPSGAGAYQQYAKQYIDIYKDGIFRREAPGSVYESSRYDLGLLEVPDTYLIQVPWSVVSTEPASIVDILLELLVGAIALLFVVLGDAETEQVAVGDSKLYRERDGKRRVVVNGVPGMARFPLLQASPSVSDLHMQRGRIPEDLKINVKGVRSGQYQHGLATGRSTIELRNQVVNGARDTLRLLTPSGAMPSLTFETSQAVKSGLLAYNVLRDLRGRGQRSFSLSLQQAAGQSAIAGLSPYGDEMVIRQAGPVKPFDLTLTRVVDNRQVKSVVRNISAEADEVVTIRPENWGVPDSPARVDIGSGAGGAPRKSVVMRATRVG
jgi:uncharacterized protein with LGFP repeats